MSGASTSLQNAANQLTKYHEVDYSDVDLKGACPLFTTKVYQLKKGLIPKSEELFKGGKLRNQLTKSSKTGRDAFVIGVLEQWAESVITGKLSEDDSSVWVSETLYLDLNIPLVDKPPGCVTQQAVFLGKHLPAIILTVFRKGTPEDKNLVEHVRDITTKEAQLLSASIVKFGHADFVLLPCVVALEELDPQSLEKEVDYQRNFARRFYRGPRQLDDESYKSLRDSVIAVSSGSYVPYFLLDSKEKEKWLLLLDTNWREVLSLIIDEVSRKGELRHLKYTPGTEFKVKVAVLETAARLGLTDKVSITASNDVASCVRRIIQHTKEERAIDISGNIEVETTQGRSSFISISASPQPRTEGNTKPEKSGPLSRDAGHLPLKGSAPQAALTAVKAWTPGAINTRRQHSNMSPSEQKKADPLSEIDTIISKQREGKSTQSS